MNIRLMCALYFSLGEADSFYVLMPALEVPHWSS